MKRRQLIRAGAAGSVAAAAAMVASSFPKPAIAQSMPEIKWRMTSSFPKSLDTLWGGAELIAKRVADATDNKFQIRTFAAGEIVPGLQVLDAVQANTVEMGHTASYYYFGKDETFTFATALPFGMNTRMINAWMYHGGGNDLLNEFYKGYNVYHLPGGHTGAQWGGWYRKEIKTPDDLKGLKMRIGGFAGRIMTKVGVVPQQLAGGDIYPALERGTIDAAEWVGPYDDEKLGFHKVAKYFYYPGWWEGSAMLSTMFNIGEWNKLPKSYQNVMAAACAEATGWMVAKYDAGHPPALKRLVAGGAVPSAFPVPVLEACYAAAQELYKEVNAKNANFKKVYDNYLAFQKDQNLVAQFAENTFDRFMFSKMRG